MSVRVMSLVWAKDLPDSQKIVLLALADSANDEGHCWPSMASLSAKCSKSERTVQGVIKELVATGHLTRKEVPGKGCHYYVHPRNDCTPAEAAPPQGTADTPAAAADKPSRTVNRKHTQRASAMPNGWKPSPFGEKTKSRGIVNGWTPDQFETHFEHFSAHHRSKGSLFKDWQDAWSTWVLNSKRFGGQSNGNRNQPDRRDGAIKALDNDLARSTGQFAGQAGRYDAGDGGGGSVVPIASARPLR